MNESQINLEKVKEIIEKHGKNPEELVEVLSELNNEYGYLPKSVLREVAKVVNLPLSKIYGTSSFYSMLSTKPLGENVIKFCENPPCHVVGASKILQSLEKELGIKIGETTKDNKFTLLTTSCIGLCGVGPVMVINDDIFGNLKSDDISKVLEKYK